MKDGQHSRTADAAAAARALHYLRGAPPLVFEDPFALGLGSPGWRRVLGNRLLAWFAFDVLFKDLRPVVAQILVRSRFAEDVLSQGLGSGARQYVILGAGFDSFALRRRDLESTLRVFELDHPDTQRVKLERLKRLGVDLPKNLEFIAVDLSVETVAMALRRSGFEAAVRTCYSWLGTTPFLEVSATLATLRSIAECSLGGCDIVFDYVLPERLLSPAGARAVRAAKEYGAKRGESWKGDFAPDQLAREVNALGYEVKEDLSAEQQFERYFKGRSDGSPPTEASHLAHLRFAPRG